MIPPHKWMQVQSAIRFGQFIAHEATHNPSSLTLVNNRFREVYGDEISVHSADMLITVGWMVLARSYEIIDTELEGPEKIIFYSGLAEQADQHCSLTSFGEFKTRYGLTIDDFPDENNQFDITLWKFIKVIRDAVSHVDYEFDNTLGVSGGETIVKFHHEFRNNCRLKMSAPFDKYFLMVEHLGVWIHSSLQSKNLIAT